MPPPFDRGEVPEKVRTRSPAPADPLTAAAPRSALPATPVPTSHTIRGPTPVRSPRERPPAGPPFPGAELRGKLPRAPGQTRWTPPRRGPSGTRGRARRAVEQGQRGARRSPSPSPVRPAGCGAASARARSRSRSVPAAPAAPPPAPAAPPPAFISPAARRPPRRPLLRRRRSLVPRLSGLSLAGPSALSPGPAAEAQVPPSPGLGSTYPRPFLIPLPLFTSAPSQIPFPGVLETPKDKSIG